MQINRTEKVIDSNIIVERNSQVLLGEEILIDYFNEQHLDILVYTFSYHMYDNDNMKPVDYQDPISSITNCNIIDHRIKPFNLRNM